MKKLNLLFITMFFFGFAQLSFSQYLTGFNPKLTEVQNAGLVVEFRATADSLENITSRLFSVTNYDGGAWSSYPIYYTKSTVSAAGKPFTTVTIEGSNDNENWVVIDTVGGASDSLETLASGSIDLGGKKFLYYRQRTKGESGNRRDTVVKTTYYFYNRKK